MERDLESEEKPTIEENLDWTAKHPVSRVIWVPVEQVHCNPYNPNSVAPPEMRLLQISIENDGFTQPIVVWEEKPGIFEVVDGFHRHLVGQKLGLTHLPCVVVNSDRTKRQDRMSSTVRHNRARGKHSVTGMSEIVQDLARLRWNDERIARELGMCLDEVLRLKQISGLAEMFEGKDFSEAWELMPQENKDESVV